MAGTSEADAVVCNCTRVLAKASSMRSLALSNSFCALGTVTLCCAACRAPLYNALAAALAGSISGRLICWTVDMAWVLLLTSMIGHLCKCSVRQLEQIVCR